MSSVHPNSEIVREDTIQLHGSHVGKRDNTVVDQDTHNVAVSPRQSNSCLWLIYGFSKEISIGGVKYIGDPNLGILRRFIWLVLVILGLAGLSYQVIVSITTFKSWPTNTNMKIEYADKMVFPAVTICNYNPLRNHIVQSHGDDIMNMITAMFTVYTVESDPPDFSNIDFEGFDMTAFRIETAHTKEDMVARCSWKQQPCSSDNFTMTLTDFGVCYTFNSGDIDMELLQVEAKGSRFALTVTLNLEQWDYILGASEVAGFRLAIHGQTEIPMIRDSGFAIAPGTRTLIGIQKRQMTNLPSPHGKCAERFLRYYSTYTYSACLMECETDYLIGKCGCRNFYMPGNATECNPEELYVCGYIAESDIGGSMGLLLGASAITIVELMDFCFVNIFRRCFA
ncbi:acid-sensing ion channel 3-like [Saccoglossus kowalevskii]|uniref:Acid-sensing ion channel 3-like n=1 Tax=Saccoglossus kowalevskii TaxID=10224 RepID=A0ABM0LZK0_SACKO|nr:PREDICTED: acid-sensing ion channel 3-like [Saccoglossus kowalevskii]